MGIGSGIFLIVVALISLVPLAAILLGTFQDGNEIIRNGISLIVDPSSLNFENYVMLFTDSPSIRDVLLFPHMRPEVVG